MGYIPTEDAKERVQQERQRGTYGIYAATVIGASGSSGHMVAVKPITSTGEQATATDPTAATVLTTTLGDIGQPTEGDVVALAPIRGKEKPVVIGTIYTSESGIPAYESGDRIISNGTRNASVTVHDSGRVSIDTADGKDFLVNGEVIAPSTYTDEDSQDAVGTILSSQFTYDDSGDAINIDPHVADANAHHSRYTDEEAQNAVGTILSSQFTYDDSGDAINIDPHVADANAHHSRYVDEEAQDAVGTILSSQFTYDDSGDAINIDPHVADANAHHSRYTDEDAQDAVGTILSSQFTYDDGGDSISIDPHVADANVHHSRYVDEEAQDAVGSILSSQFTYDDSGDAINIDPHETDSDAHHSRYTDTEASNAAPVQSVFGRVGNVVAQAGDYAASQISNFTTAVIDAIDGADITPSSVDTNSLNTGVVGITGSGLIKEVGYVDHGSVPAGSASTATVSLSKSYSSPPAVVSGLSTTEKQALVGNGTSSHEVDSVTTSDFRSVVYNGNTSSSVVIDRAAYVVVQS